MKKRKSAMQAASVWLTWAYLILATFLGWSLCSVLLRMDGGSFQTVRLAICLCLAAIVQLLMSRYAVFLVGALSGKELLILRKPGGCLAKEEGHFLSRKCPAECAITPFVMASPTGVETGTGFFLLGGVLGNLVLVLISLLLMITGLVRAASWGGTFLLSLLLTGFWAIAYEGLPAYHGRDPNSAMKVLLLMKDSLTADAYEKDMAILYGYAKGDSIKEIEIPDPELDLDEDMEPMSLFRASYLLRVYELLLFQKRQEEAGRVLASLYYHLMDFPEELQGRLLDEALYMLAVDGSPEAIDLAADLLDSARLERMEEEKSFESYRALKEYAESSGEIDYQGLLKAARDHLSEVAFSTVRDGWTSIL